MKFTDDSPIPVPVRKPSSAMNGEDPPKKKHGLFARLVKGKNEGNSNFTIKQIKRGEYLKHYAKDEQGWYCGTEEPAEDCILKEEDPVKKSMRSGEGWRNGVDGDVNSLGGSTLAGEGYEQKSHIYGMGKEDDGVIR